MKTKLHLLISIVLCITVFSACDDTKENNENTPLLPSEPEIDKIEELLNEAGHIGTLQETKRIKGAEQEISDALVQFEEPTTGTYYWGYNSTRTVRFSETDITPSFTPPKTWEVLLPGTLLQGYSIMGNTPQIVPIYDQRKPGRILLSIADYTIEDMDNWYIDTEMYRSRINLAMEELLNKHIKNPPLRADYKIEPVSSPEEMALKLGLNVKNWPEIFKQNFGYWDKNKNYVAVKYNQIFFSFSYEPSGEGYRGILTDEIKRHDLEKYTGSGNPICYVSSVTYGRSYIVLYESNVNIRKLELAVKGTFNNRIHTSQIFNEAECKVIQIGDSPLPDIETIFGDSDNLRDFLSQNEMITPANIGVPISYKISHLIDNSPVWLSNFIDYKVTYNNYIPVGSNNYIIIDICDVTMRPPQSKQEISNYSTLTLKRIKAIERVNGSDRYYDIIENPIIQTIKNTGAEIPIYKTVIFQNLNEDNHIIIEAQFHVKNQTNKPYLQMEEKEFTLTQEFVFDKTNNVWKPVQQAERSFERLTKHLDNFGGATMDFILNFRFHCDGFTYPFSSINM